MSKIPFSFTALPKIFRKNGVLDPKKKNFSVRLRFIYWAFSKCYTVSSIQDGITYDAFEFSCSVAKAAEESGLIEDEVEAQFEYFIKHEFLIKVNGSIKNRLNKYRWNSSKLVDEKIVHLETIQDKSKEENRDKLRVEDVKKPEPTQENRNQNRNQTGTDYREEDTKKTGTKPEQTPPFYRNDRAIESPSLNSDNVAKSHACENLSPSSKRQITAFFNPRSYKLRDGQPLSIRMQNSICKYSENERKRALANVQYYEEYVDSGQTIKTEHERFLQYCIRDDLAMKKENCGRNDLLARVMKEEYRMNEMEILAKSIRIKKSDHEEPISISKELPHQTFTNILDNYINTYYPGLKYAP
jgi:hypothetical protein